MVMERGEIHFDSHQEHNLLGTLLATKRRDDYMVMDHGVVMMRGEYILVVTKSLIFWEGYWPYGYV